MKYSFIITDEKNDFNNMESTCYLIKLEQKNNINKKYNNIDIPKFLYFYPLYFIKKNIQKLFFSFFRPL